MPAGFLGGLWRVSLLGLGFKAAMCASGAALERCAQRASAAEKPAASRRPGVMRLAHFEMPLTLERRQIDAGDTGDSNIIERQVSYDPDLGRPIVTLDRAQVGAVPVDRHAKFSASSRVGEFDADMAARDGFLQGRARFFAQARFHPMVSPAHRLHYRA